MRDSSARRFPNQGTTSSFVLHSFTFFILIFITSAKLHIRLLYRFYESYAFLRFSCSAIISSNSHPLKKKKKRNDSKNHDEQSNYEFSLSDFTYYF